MQETTLTCTLAIAGRDFEPDEVTAALGLAPTEIWRQRRAWLKGRADLPNVEWRLTVGPDPAWSSVDDAVAALKARVLGREDALLAVSARLGAKVGVVLELVLMDERPIYAIAPEHLRFLG